MNNIEQRELQINQPNILRKRVLILNLMPDMITTEKQFIKVLRPELNNIDITWLAIENKTFTHTSNEYVSENYSFFSQVKNNYYDGLIVTGAPVEQLEFDDVSYHQQLSEIINWSQTHVTSKVFICWASQFALNTLYNIKKEVFSTKLHGVFSHTKCIQSHPLLQGIDRDFNVPHSRFSQSNQQQIRENKNLRILAQSDDANIHIIESVDSKNIFINGHMEYDFNTLDIEYHNAINRGEKPAVPRNYYKNDIANLRNITDTWSENALHFFTNWIHKYVTPTNRLNKVINL